MKEDMLRVFGRSLIRLGMSSAEMRKEVERFKKRPELFSCFFKKLAFKFANFDFRMEVEAESPDKVDLNEVKYEIKDRDTNKILISTFCIA